MVGVAGNGGAGSGPLSLWRSVEIFDIWEDVFGGHERLLRVLAWQSGNAWSMERIILPHRDAYKHADALAVAPYMGMNVLRQGDGLTAGETVHLSGRRGRMTSRLEADCG